MKFPHPCGEEFEGRVAAGEDPLTVVPDEYVLVKGGEAPLPAVGIPFSCVVGPSQAEAACAVPHGRVRFTTVGELRKTGGAVRWLPETSRWLTINKQHVNVIESGSSTFSELVANPVPRRDRVDGDRK